MDTKESEAFEKLAKMKSLENMDKWYSWGSPIGLSIWFLTLVLIAAIVKLTFFTHFCS